MSYRAVHGKVIDRHNYVKTFCTTSGPLVPALPPLLFVVVSGFTDWYSLKTALMISMIISLLSLFFLSFNARRKIYDNGWRLLLVSLLEMSVGTGVVLLKLVLGE